MQDCSRACWRSATTLATVISCFKGTCYRAANWLRLGQKISGPFRSFDALVNFCRIRGYVSTARKNGVNALDALQRVFCGHPFVPTINTS